jgi:DmsE family decaheme c-type cytochrome
MEIAMKPRATGIALLFCGLLLAGSAFAQTTEPAATVAAETQTAPEAEATPLCSDCHEDQTRTWGANPHAQGKARKGTVANDTCESCHGDGKAHAEAGGDTTLIYKPQGLAGANRTCLGCHDANSDRIARHSGMHANSTAVNCLTCHSIHHSEPAAPHLLSRPQLQLCASCHSTQSASFRNKPYAHRLGRGGMECASCHEPHGRPGRDNLRKTETREQACLSCHSDKRGPFVFEHGASSTRDCTTCHEAHGSSNPKQLKRATVAQLCMECHSPINTNTLGSQPPSFHNLSLPRYQNCTTCHVAVHGSHRDPQLLK